MPERSEGLSDRPSLPHAAHELLRGRVLHAHARPAVFLVRLALLGLQQPGLRGEEYVVRVSITGWLSHLPLVGKRQQCMVRLQCTM